jgi:protease I
MFFGLGYSTAKLASTKPPYCIAGGLQTERCASLYFRTQPDKLSMATLLMPPPDSDFDPTESGVPWRTTRDHGHNVVFATPAGRRPRADPKMVTGEGLGILSPLLKADDNGRSAYLYMEQSDAFRRPISYGEIRAVDFDGLLLTGGHAPGMRFI